MKNHCRVCITATEPIVLLENSLSQTTDSVLLFRKPVGSIIVRHYDRIPAAFEKIEQTLQAGKFLAGYFSYEAGYYFENRFSRSKPITPLIELYIFDRGIQCAPADIFYTPAAAGSSVVLNPPIYDTTYEAYTKNIIKIKKYIRAGETYQINFTFRSTFETAISAVEMYQYLRQRQPSAYSAFIRTKERAVISCSPELFFKQENSTITVKPMKGTAARGRYSSEDTSIAAQLYHDEKSRAENLMIVDLLRNDLGRVCETGSVSVQKLFDIERYPTLFQMTSTITGKRKPNSTWFDIFRALFPCGSVTGAPKVRAMEIIQELESSPRGIYTGAIGYFAPNGNAQFNVAIRTIELNAQHGSMGIGSGIIWDSAIQSEYDECLLKGTFLNKTIPNFNIRESLLWNNDYTLLHYHRERMHNSAEYFNYPFHEELFSDCLQQAAQQCTIGTKYKITIDLNTAGVFSSICEEIKPPLPEHTARIHIADIQTHSSDIFLYHKTTNRRQYNELLQRYMAEGYFDVLFSNERDEITEGARSNIFIQKGNNLLTPPIDCGLLAGTYRRYILENNPDAREAVIHRDDVYAADVIYVCNAVRGMTRVQIDR